MTEFMQLGESFFIPFFVQLWEFLGTEIFFGLTFKHLIVGGFLIRLSLVVMNMIFGIGRTGVAEKAVHEYRFRTARYSKSDE